MCMFKKQRVRTSEKDHWASFMKKMRNWKWGHYQPKPWPRPWSWTWTWAWAWANRCSQTTDHSRHCATTSSSGIIQQLFNKFEAWWEVYYISFLPAWLHTVDNQLHSELYHKPTNRNTILQGNSFHPTSLIKGSPISQFHRAKRICNTDQLYAGHAPDIADRFQREFRGERADVSRSCCDNISQPQSLQSGCVNAPTGIMCCVKYSARGSEFITIVNKH